MGGPLQPRKVDSDICYVWCAEAIQLSTRHPFRNTMIVCIFCFPYFHLPESSWFDWQLADDSYWPFLWLMAYGLICPPIFFSTMVAACYCAYYGEPWLPRLLSATQWKGVFKTLLVYAMIILIVVSLGSLLFFSLLIWLAEPVQSGDSSANLAQLRPDMLTFYAGEKLWWSLAVYLVFGAITWFIAALMCLAKCPLIIGIKLAYDTLCKNRFIFWLPIILALIMTPLCWLSGIFVIPIAVLLGTLMYVSFRDIFMGRQRSFPVTSRKQAYIMANEQS